jgi:hypothetical protein
MATLLPLELVYTIIEIVVHQPTLAALSLVSHKFRNSCTPRLWRHLDIHGFADLATMILALRSNRQLARHVKTITFMLDDTSEEAYWSEGFHTLPQSCLKKILEVGEEGENAGATEGDKWGTAKMLPQKLLSQLDADGLPSAERSYAVGPDLNGIWDKSIESGVLASPTCTLRCLCFEGMSHIYWDLDVAKPFALHLYGEPSNWTLHEGPGDEPTFARFPGTKCICFSIYKWGDYPYYEACNIFERCREYDRDFSVGGLDKVVVRMARDVVGKVCKALSNASGQKREMWWNFVYGISQTCHWMTLSSVSSLTERGMIGLTSLRCLVQKSPLSTSD